MELFGINWVGVTPENGKKLLLSIIFIAVILVISKIIRAALGLILSSTKRESIQTKFWSRQGVSLFATVVLIIGTFSIWLDDPKKLSTALGLMSAGLAFALQQVITSIAGYFVILRGNTFTVGDRISMGGVRGDVMRLGFIQTTIMEMGQPPSVQGADPAMWVKSRQFTGRIVTVSNSKIFAEPVYNYTRDFPFIWEEMWIPISFTADRNKAEEILLKAAKEFAYNVGEMAVKEKEELHSRFGVEPIDLEPSVFCSFDSNWVQMTVRFVVLTHKIRKVKDSMSRQILDELAKAKIGIASSTYDIVGFPPIEIKTGKL